jgi:hypothetical protein
MAWYRAPGVGLLREMAQYAGLVEGVTDALFPQPLTRVTIVI